MVETALRSTTGSRPLRSGSVLAVLLVVAAIVAFLLLWGIPYIPSPHGTHGNLTRTTINNLTMALEQYRDDFGAYPPDGGDGSETALVRYLDGDPSNGGPGKAYFSFKPEELDGTRFLDHFGDAYAYDELASEGLGREFGHLDGDPRSSKIKFDSFDIWSKAGRPDEPYTWITNYRKVPD